MTDDERPYIRCQSCGWCHVGATEAARAACFNCGGVRLAVVAAAEVPRGVTLQAIHWPLDDDPIMANPEAVAEIAIRAFAKAKDAALAENRRLGIPSYGTEDDSPKLDHS